MKFSKLNSLILAGLIAIIGVIIMQLFLLNQAYTFEKKESEAKIFYALQDVVEKIHRDNKTILPATNYVRKVNESYFIANVNDVFENNILEHYLRSEFAKVKLDLDFEYAIYNCATDEMVYGNYISSDGKPKKKCENCFTKNSDLTYYFAVRFPKLQMSYFSSLQQYWLFTFVLFGVLIIYVYSVLLMLKQKHYTELQRDFINNMTHEFKTPLASILIASKYASAQVEITQNPKLSRYLSIIIEQSNKLNQHIEQILSLAKVESSQIQLQLEKINWLKTIELVEENIALKYPKKAIISYENKEITILADRFHFYNIIYNVIENAVKYANEKPKIEISWKENQSNYELQFLDNGQGIPEKDLPFIFDKFYRVSREDNKEIEGFGIGLSYVKKICQLHRWKVAIANTTNGLQITIRIPKKDIYE
jgi:two-component system, OmpR family, phosphate regulon sensor histidine kinase PhoR